MEFLTKRSDGRGKKTSLGSFDYGWRKSSPTSAQDDGFVTPLRPNCKKQKLAALEFGGAEEEAGGEGGFAVDVG